jgi:hypothetical protein
MITGFDHFIILVGDLNTGIESFRKLGFEVKPGGEHPAFGSHNALVALADGTYLELVAFRDPALAAKTFWGDLVRKLEIHEGFGSYVLSSNDLTNDVQAIRQRGLEVADPRPGTRTRPDGQTVAWHTAVVGGTISEFLPFLIQDDSPRTRRVEPATQGLGSRLRVKEIIIAVKNIEVARQAYRELLDIEPRFVQNTTGELTGYRVSAPWGAVVLAHPERNRNAMSDQLAQRGQGPYALTLIADDVNRARSDIVARGVKVEDDATGFLIAPEATCGARIRLGQAS